MNGLTPDTIDAIAVADRILAKPGRFRITDNEVLAMAGCLVALDSQLDALEPNVTTNAGLAAAIAVFIRADEAMTAARSSDGYYPQPLWAAREAAFNALKITFEQEFPHV